MLKTVVAATTAVTIATSTAAYAQRDSRPDGNRRWQPSTEDMRAFQAARLAALRAGLMLSAEQEKHWPAFEQAMRDLQQQRLGQFAKMREARRGGQPQSVDPADRMRQRATRLSESGAVLKRLADATDPLYRSLDDAQKRRFAILTRMSGPRGIWQQRGRDGGEQGMQRGQRRTDALPTENVPAVERMTFTGKVIDGAVAGRVFGTKLTIEKVILFGDKAIMGEAAVFGGKDLSFGDKTTPFGGKLRAVEGPTFSRKIIIGEPPVFGSKRLQSI